MNTFGIVALFFAGYALGGLMMWVTLRPRRPRKTDPKHRPLLSPNSNRNQERIERLRRMSN